MNTIFSKRLVLFGFMVCSTYSISVSGQTSYGVETVDFDAAAVVDNDVLDTMRGGFVTLDGVRFDIGIHKTVTVDGVMQVDNNINIQNANLYGHVGSVTNINELNSAVRTIVQNSLDNKSIINQTELNLVVKNSASFQHAYVDSMRSMLDIKAVQDTQILR